MRHERIGLQYILPSKEMIAAAKQAHEIAVARSRIDKLFGVVGEVIDSHDADVYGLTAHFHQSGGRAIRRAFVRFDALDDSIIFWPKKGDSMANRALVILGEDDDRRITDIKQGKFYDVDMTKRDSMTTVLEFPTKPLEFPTRHTNEEAVDDVFILAGQAIGRVIRGNIPARPVGIVEASKIIGNISTSKVVNF